MPSASHTPSGLKESLSPLPESWRLQDTLAGYHEGYCGTPRYWIPEDLRTLPHTELWMGLRSIGMVERILPLADSPTVERRFFLNSIRADGHRFAQTARECRGVEQTALASQRGLLRGCQPHP